MQVNDLHDDDLIAFTQKDNTGLIRGLAIAELARRAVANHALLEAAYAAIRSEKRIGFHAGFPAGWLGADEIYLSQDAAAIRGLLHEMDSWEDTEQEDLVRHWAGKDGLAALTSKLRTVYGWEPRYRI